MKKSLLFLTAALSLMLTSCFDMVEEIYLNRDGSGKYVYTIDMSEIFSDPMMGQIMAQSMSEQMGTEELEIDSVINFSEIQAAPASLSAQERELFGRMTLTMQLSQSKSKGIITINFPFNKVSEINQFNDIYAKMQTDGGMGMAAAGMSPVTSEFFVNGKVFSRKVTSTGKPSDAMDEETLSMARMMFADAKMKTIYHLPGQVRKTDIEGAEINGSTVTVTNGLMDVLDGNANFNGEIKFR
jgi:hypothetical protein